MLLKKAVEIYHTDANVQFYYCEDKVPETLIL